MEWLKKKTWFCVLSRISHFFMCCFCNSISSSYSLFIYVFIYFASRIYFENFCADTKDRQNTTRKLQISFKNIDIQILDKIQVNQSSTLKDLYTMTKWDLFLEFENESTDKNWSIWYVNNRMKGEKKPHKIISIDAIKEWQNSTSFHNKKHLIN